MGDDEYNHESEAMAHNPDLSKFHYIIDNNGSYEDTYKQIIDIVNDVIEKQLNFLKYQQGLVEIDALESGEANE